MKYIMRVKAFGHIMTIFRHKYYVCKYYWRVGLYWQGIAHDLSKFSFDEFSAGIKYYSGECSPNSIQKSVEGYSKAWLHHKNSNKHHSEYWLDFFEQDFIDGNEKISPIEMPAQYLVEMFCDRVAACKVYKGMNYTQSDPLDYYCRQKDRLLMHRNTRKKLERLLQYLAFDGEERAFLYAQELLKTER